MNSLCRFLLIKLIKTYQLVFSPLLGNHCRFSPTCSQYCILAISKYGALRGLWKGFKRILKCNPWGKGGIDNP